MQELVEKETEKEPENSENKLKNFLNALTDGVAILNSELNFLWANNSFLKKFGIKKEGLISKNILDVMPEIEEAGIYDMYLEVIRSKEPFIFEDLFDHPLLGKKNFYIKAFGVGDGLGIISVDITDLKREEEKIIAGKKRLETQIDALIDGVIIFDISGNIRQGNKNFVKMLGYESMDQISGRNITSFVVQKDIPKIIPIINEGLKKGFFRNFEAVFLTNQKKELTIEINGSVFKDEKDAEERIIAILRDVTERKRAEEEMNEKNNLRDTILTTTPDFFILKDRASIYRMVNPAFCRFMGKKEDEIIGKTDYDLFSRDEAEAHRNGDIFVMESKKSETMDWEVTGAVGKSWLQVTKSAVFNSEGVVEGVLCTIQDITDMKQLQEKKEMKAEELENFNKLAVDRELRMIELKKEVNDLLEQMSERPKYET